MRNSMKGAIAVFLGFVAISPLVASYKSFSYLPSGLVHQEQTDESQIPLTDYLAPEPTDQAERAKRKEKSRRHGSTVKRIKHEPRISLITTSDSSVEWLPSLPVALSDAVIIGEVAKAQAYLSDDKSDIYSEFSVRIEQVLKGNNQLSLSPGAEVIAEREGGGVRFPSGHVQRYIISGERMPKVGCRYVLFLKSNGLGQDFRLLRGYELRAGQVFPLDSFSNDAAYKDMEQDTFISVVRSAISDPSQVVPGKVGSEP